MMEQDCRLSLGDVAPLQKIDDGFRLQIVTHTPPPPKIKVGFRVRETVDNVSITQKKNLDVDSL